MDAEKQKALEAAGWKFGDAADFLGMTDEERQMLDARVEAALAVRRQRELQNLSQKQLANRLRTSQPRVAKIEHAATDVSLDQILRAFVAAGGRFTIKHINPSRTGNSTRKPRRSKQQNAELASKARIAEIHIELVETDQ